jgi:hypothetical protein
MNTETERLEMLGALKQSRRRYLEVLETCASLVERQANQGDPLAKHVISELDKAEIALKAENIAGHAFVDEASRG